MSAERESLLQSRKFPEGDPVVVLPPQSLAERQAGLNGPSGSPTSPSGRVPMREAFDLVYHVPRSQVWEGSRGKQTGHVHLHVRRGEAFKAETYQTRLSLPVKES